jgi:murein endopeptidase
MDVLKEALTDTTVFAKGGIRIQDISLPTGGFISDHTSHQRGVDVDIHMRDISGKFGDVDYRWTNTSKTDYRGPVIKANVYSAYDQDYAEALLIALGKQKNVHLLLFNDPAFLSGGVRRSSLPTAVRSKIIKSTGSHAYHIHMRVKLE